MSCGQSSRGPMANAMSHHLLDPRREVSEPIRDARPCWQHHLDGGNRHIIKRQVVLTAGLCQSSGGTHPGDCVIPSMGSLRQLLGQILASPPPPSETSR
jgi:hypothetical protein